MARDMKMGELLIAKQGQGLSKNTVAKLRGLWEAFSLLTGELLYIAAGTPLYVRQMLIKINDKYEPLTVDNKPVYVHYVPGIRGFKGKLKACWIPVSYLAGKSIFKESTTTVLLSKDNKPYAPSHTLTPITASELKFPNVEEGDLVFRYDVSAIGGDVVTGYRMQDYDKLYKDGKFLYKEGQEIPLIQTSCIKVCKYDKGRTDKVKDMLAAAIKLAADGELS